MKTWQWASIMWILLMICFYVSDRHIAPLLMSFIFIFVTIIDFFDKEVEK